jgi:hypothetical protein
LETKKVTKKISQDVVSLAVARAVGNLAAESKTDSTDEQEKK